MIKIIYNVPLTVTAESNETLIAKKTIRVIDCGTSSENTNLCAMWNNTRCTNDSLYCNPFVKGDTIYFQYKYSKEQALINNGHRIQLMDSETGLPLTVPEGTIVKQTLIDENETYYLNILIDTTNLVQTCFYLMVQFLTCNLTEEETEEAETCVSDLEIEDVTDPIILEECYNQFCAVSYSVYSEPYCKVACEDTIMIEGVYTNYDCDGLYYKSTNTTTNLYKSAIRVFGEISPNQFDIEEVVVDQDERKSTTMVETFTFMTKRIPYYVARKIANIFASKEIYVDGNMYKRAVNLSKNNEEGTMWIIKTTLVQRCGEINFTCD
jgi:hypothetical protein